MKAYNQGDHYQQKFKFPIQNYLQIRFLFQKYYLTMNSWKFYQTHFGHKGVFWY